MKKIFKCAFAVAAAFALSTGSVNAATASRKIDRNTCDTVYTNYYFFLDANTVSYFNQGPLTSYNHSNIAEYTNNSYQITNFNTYNIGYGQMEVTTTSRTSSDGTTSMSLDDFYSYMVRGNSTNGAYSVGTNNYVLYHNWYSIDTTGNQKYHTDNLSISGASLAQLKAATVNANSTISLQSTVSPTVQNPLNIRIDRSYYGYLSGSPVTLEGNQWYLHPAVYYIQYCSPKAQTPTQPTQPTQPSTPQETYYHVYYRSSTTDVVTNMPSDSTHNTKDDMYIDGKNPVRQGYTFLGWTTDSTAVAINPSFNPGSKYTDRKDLILYAVWQKNQEQTKPDVPSNPQTGIEDYLLPFGGVASLSGLGLIVLKKKKGFKQF